MNVSLAFGQVYLEALREYWPAAVTPMSEIGPVVEALILDGTKDMDFAADAL